MTYYVRSVTFSIILLTLCIILLTLCIILLTFRIILLTLCIFLLTFCIILLTLCHNNDLPKHGFLCLHREPDCSALLRQRRRSFLNSSFSSPLLPAAAGCCWQFDARNSRATSATRYNGRHGDRGNNQAFSSEKMKIADTQ